MHNLSLDALSQIMKQLDIKEKYKIFVETGTNRGRTIIPMSKHFDVLYTIELDGTFFYKTKQKATDLDIQNIRFIHGDSGEKIKEVVDQLTEKAIYFLDSHWCGYQTAFNGKDCPLLEELEYINEHDKNASCLIIDDYRLFGQVRQKPEWTEQKFVDKYGQPKVEDWSEITDKAIQQILGNRIDRWLDVDDRLVVLLKAVNEE